MFPLIAVRSCLRNAAKMPSRGWLMPQMAVSLKTYAPLASGAKTPMQAWGYDYLHRQKAMNRPISPHLTVYKPMLTWMVSGLHRISGVVMGGTIAVFSIGLMVLPFDFTGLINFIRDLHLPAVIVYALKYAIAWPLTFHTLNGVRFLAFDLAKGTDIPTVYKTGWTVVGLSLAIAAVLTFWRS